MWSSQRPRQVGFVVMATLGRSVTMSVTVRRVAGVTRPGEAGRRVNGSLVALGSQLPGFVAYYWADAGGGVVVSTSVFQDQASAHESNKTAADWVRQNNLAKLYPTPPQITAGEVVAQ